MKGLLIKDFYAVFKQLKVYLLFIVVLTFIPGFSMLTFAIVYATMLPMTAIAYDERSQWDKLAAMMPYSTADIVLSKYALGLVMILSTAIFACFAQAVVGIFLHTRLTGEFFTKLALVSCFALVLESIELPVLIKFGTEKGRLLMIFFLVLVGVGGAALIENLTAFLFEDMKLQIILPLTPLAALMITALSALIAIMLYNGKKE